MAISTNSIIHYTKKLKTLKAILKDGAFKIKYCDEFLEIGKRRPDAQFGSKLAHPMISFCDIPLSHAKKHFKAYGEFGIGLSKEWAFKNKVNPVLYIDRHSLVAETIHKLIKAKTLSSIMYQIKCYSKNYTGTVCIKGKEISEYKFYDEREWRLVPPKNEIQAPISIKSEDYQADKNKYNEKIATYRLKFAPNDISYIIVKYTSQISGVIKFLRDEYGSKCSDNQLHELFSKVCSTEQIEADY
jgi:hypothetical protein